MLVDANILLYAVDESSPFHDRASSWLTNQLNGTRRVGFPWFSLVALSGSAPTSVHPRDP
jgi:uncharacterized protein